MNLPTSDLPVKWCVVRAKVNTNGHMLNRNRIDAMHYFNVS